MDILEKAGRYRCDGIEESIIKMYACLEFLQAYDVITSKEVIKLQKRISEIQNKQKCWIHNAKYNENKSPRSSRSTRTLNK